MEYGRIVKGAQNLSVVGHFDSLWENFAKDNFKPDTVVELGTGAGWFHPNLVKGSFVIHTFDIKDIVPEQARFNEINYHVLDIFKHEQEVAEFLKYGCVLLLCDNGEKIREVNMFAKYLKTGDALMVHDYCYDLELFNKHKYISSCEVIYSEISDALKNFEPYHHDYMMEIGWGLFRRR